MVCAGLASVATTEATILQLICTYFPMLVLLKSNRNVPAVLPMTNSRCQQVGVVKVLSGNLTKKPLGS